MLIVRRSVNESVMKDVHNEWKLRTVSFNPYSYVCITSDSAVVSAHAVGRRLTSTADSRKILTVNTEQYHQSNFHVLYSLTSYMSSSYSERVYSCALSVSMRPYSFDSGRRSDKHLPERYQWASNRDPLASTTYVLSANQRYIVPIRVIESMKLERAGTRRPVCRV